MSHKKDFTGQKINSLTFVSESGRNATGGVIWELVCECGNIVHTVARKVVNGHTKTCGCGKSKRITNMKTKHGLFWKNRRLYQVWAAMRMRCSNPKNKSYRTYGARGITVVDEWDDFKTFYEWAISSGYKEGLEIDRIDNNGNYGPDNCRFMGKSEHIKSHWSDGTFKSRGKKNAAA